MRISPAGRRYLLFQIPGWALLALLLVLLESRGLVPFWATVAILAAWIVKDLLLYPFLRRAYEVDERSPLEQLIGERATVVEPLAPAGYVTIRGELWRAEASDAAQPVGREAAVVVRAVRGLTLLVEEQ